MKKCSRCKKFKNNNEFGKRASSKDGLDSRCLECIKECSKQSSEKNRIKNSNNIIFTNKLCSTCRAEKPANCFGTNPGSKDGLRGECKNCRNTKIRIKYEVDAKFKDNESARAAQNYIEDRDRILGRSKEWSKNNPEKKVMQTQRRTARLYGQIEFNLPSNFIQTLKQKQNNKCIYCSRDNIKLTIDHILPLSRGGKHCFDNIALACGSCNSSKNNKTLEEWLTYNKKLQLSGIVSDLLALICSNLQSLLANKVKNNF